MRDMIQSHLLQVMALVAMEPPVAMRAEDIRSETTKVLNAVRHPRPADVPHIAVRGQYTAGTSKGDYVAGYRDEPDVDPNSQTRNLRRPQGVHGHLAVGGRAVLSCAPASACRQKTTEIVINFKPTPHRLFGADHAHGPKSNQIVINVQPDEGIRLRFEGKVPGIGMDIKSVVMDFDYAEQFQAEPPEAYATLLLDAMRGDQTLFKQREEIEQAWRIVQPILDHWESSDEPVPGYSAGTWGPTGADRLLQRDHRHWHIG